MRSWEAAELGSGAGVLISTTDLACAALEGTYYCSYTTSEDVGLRRGAERPAL